jgi:hypothetical protein
VGDTDELSHFRHGSEVGEARIWLKHLQEQNSRERQELRDAPGLERPRSAECDASAFLYERFAEDVRPSWLTRVL